MEIIMKIHRYEVRGLLTELELEYPDTHKLVSIMTTTENIKQFIPLLKGRLIFVDMNDNKQRFVLKKYVTGRDVEDGKTDRL